MKTWKKLFELIVTTIGSSFSHGASVIDRPRELLSFARKCPQSIQTKLFLFRLAFEGDAYI